MRKIYICASTLVMTLVIAIGINTINNELAFADPITGFHERDYDCPIELLEDQGTLTPPTYMRCRASGGGCEVSDQGFCD